MYLYVRLMVWIQLLLTYTKGYVLYIRLTYSRYILYDIIILKPFLFFHISHDCITIICIIVVIVVAVTYNIILTLFLSLKIKL